MYLDPPLNVRFADFVASAVQEDGVRASSVALRHYSK